MYWFILLCWSAVTCRSSSHLTVNIAENGKDNLTCLNGSTPCNTLSYVLNNTDIFSTAVTVNITYDQSTVSAISNVTVNSSLTFKGYGKTKLTFQTKLIRFISPSQNTGYTIMFEGLKVSNTAFRFYIFNNLVISGCTFQQFGGFHGFVSNTYVTRSVFMDSNIHMPNTHLFLLTVPNFSNESELMIHGCSFIDIAADHPLISVVYNKIDHTDVSFSRVVNVSFTNFKNNRAPCLSFLGVATVFSGEFIIKNCLFLNNSVISSASKLNLVQLGFSLGKTNLDLINVNFTNNTVKSTSYTRSVSILALESPAKILPPKLQAHALINDVRFSKNIGTPLYMDNINVTFKGNVKFENNTGVLGGGIGKNGGLLNVMDNNTEILFIRNIAVFGGAVYASQLQCKPMFHWIQSPSVSYSNNVATTLGNDMFLQDYSCFFNICQGKCSNETPSIVTEPHFINISGVDSKENNISLFPGQLLSFSADVIDYYGMNTSCIVQLILVCDTELLVCTSNDSSKEVLKLNGNSEFLLTSDVEKITVYVSSSSEHHLTFNTPKLVFQCESVNKQANMYINLVSCPLGYLFHFQDSSFIAGKQLGKCECIDNPNVRCDNSTGIACIKNDYWYGDINPFGRSKNTSALCEYPYCKRNLQPCPINGLSDSYDKLPVTQDKQCVGLNGGVLCKSCQKNAIFTFMAVKCIQKSSCKTWHYYIILIIAVVFQFLLGCLLLLALKTRLKIGSGYLYGPLFYLAVLGRIPFGLYEDFNGLKITISIFQSIFLLNLEFFGEIQLCFFPSMNHRLYNYSLHFLGPTIIAIVLLGAVMLARRFPKQFLSIQSSPVQVICVLALLSFWSVITTCIEILKPIKLNNEYRVSLEPELQYFKDPVHAVMSVVSLIVLVVIIFPFIFILLFSPLLNYKFNLSRFQPILDELQSCYDDRFRWYSGVYLVSWIILNISMPFAIFTLCLILICSVHFIMHPYKSRWMNAVDSILLVDLILLALLFLDISHENLRDFSDNASIKDIQPVIYLLVLLPLLYIAVGGLWLLSRSVAIWFKIHCTKAIKLRPVSLSVKNQNEQLHDPIDSTESSLLEDNQLKLYNATHERESLIRVVQELGEVPSY